MLALEVRDLQKKYHNGVEALKGISFSVEQGDFFALLGPNGAGKSTTIGIITSLINKTSGQVSVFNNDLDTQRGQVKTHIGLVPQEFNFNIFERVEDIITNQAGYYGIEKRIAVKRAEKYLRQLGLWEKRRDIARNLSGGMKRRLMIARALVHEPKLLILDEPSAGVDIELRRSMWTFLREINEKGTTVILTTHYLEEAESLCRNIAIIDQGKIIEFTNMKRLLNKLNVETFILDLAEPLYDLPALDHFHSELIDSHTLSVDIEKTYHLNDLFELLGKHGIKVLSMRNKANRLEELFIRLVGD